MLSWLVRPRVALLAFVMLLVASGTGATQSFLRGLIGQTLRGRVTSIVDGDTVDIRLVDGASVRVRLEGIDAPEKSAPFGPAASDAVRVALFDQTVSLRAIDVDRYGRLVARVSANGRDSSLGLVRAGLACHYARHRVDATLVVAQDRARAAAAGFWTPGALRPAACSLAPSPPPPSAGITVPHRFAGHERVASQPVVYHGNRNSKVYHMPLCRNYTCPNCVIPFSSHEEARAAGFRPAGDCLGK